MYVSVDLTTRPPDAAAPPRLGCSVGIMAYNEETNIADAIRSILRSDAVTELVVVASGCEDRTAAIVTELSLEDRRVRLIEQPHREGKASAINLFISAARSPILLMVSADVLVRDDTIDVLLEHFDDPTVGMVGGRPTPVNGETTFLGHAVNLQWRLHDRIAREDPKLGEIVAFRNVIPEIPLDTAVDELSIQCLITQLGYTLVYEPRAVVYNRGPATVGDFLRQRRRIYAGHLLVRKQQGYAASTMGGHRVVRAFVASGSFTTPRAALWSVGTVGLEVAARGLGRYDFKRRRSHQVWDVIASTKDAVAGAAAAQTQQSVLAFRIADFHRLELELGMHASRLLLRRVADRIRRGLGPETKVSVQRSGTVVAVQPCDRDAAERTARQLMSELAGHPIPIGSHRGEAEVALTCAIITFPQTGPPLATALLEPAPVAASVAPEPQTATAVVG
jgi:poly-beta-1,6-N-acetyl-D-glucosamine synthase